MRFLRSALCIAILLFPVPARAVEGGMSPYAKGFGGFMAGLVPPPGYYSSYIFYHIQGSADALPRSGIIELNVSGHADLDLYEGTWVTDYLFLGGCFGVCVVFVFFVVGFLVFLVLLVG